MFSALKNWWIRWFYPPIIHDLPPARPIDMSIRLADAAPPMTSSTTSQVRVSAEPLREAAKADELDGTIQTLLEENLKEQDIAAPVKKKRTPTREKARADSAKRQAEKKSESKPKAAVTKKVNIQKPERPKRSRKTAEKS